MSATTSSGPEPHGQVEVLALIDHFVLGGAETMLTRFALAAPTAGIRLRTACLMDLDGNPAAAPLIRAGCPPVNLGLSGRPGIHALHVVRDHIKQVAPQVVHTHLGSSDFLGSLAARTLGIPAVSTIHTTLWSDRWRYRAMRRITQSCASRVVAVSESARQEFLAQGWKRPDDLVTIHNGIDVVPAPGEGAAVRRELGLAPDDLVAVMVSALRAEKAHDVSVESIRRLQARFPRLRLVIVGQGLMSDEIARAAADLGDAVIQTGLREDVMRIMDAADLCLHPSRRDAFPNTIIEAMAARVPVIATATGGIPEILSRPGVGSLIPAPPDPGTLAAAIGDLLDAPERRRSIADAARQAYEDRFTAEPWVRRTRRLYDDVLTQAPRHRLGRRGSGSPASPAAGLPT